MDVIRHKILCALVCACLLTLAGALAGGASAQQNEDAGSSAAGIFRANCAFCHGENGKGAVSIPDLPNFTDPRFQSARTDDRLINSITHGRDEMPSFGDVLKPGEIRALVAYVRHFAVQPASKAEAKGKPKAAAVSERPSASAPAADGLLERAIKGQAHIYDLTHVLSSKTPTYDGGKNEYRDQMQAEVDKQGYALGIVTVPEHFGTHVDAPAHFIAGAPTIDKLDPRHLIAPAMVIDVRDEVKHNPDYRLTPREVESWIESNGPIPDGAVVILYTGWGERYGDANKYRNPDSKGVLHFPGYSAEAVKYLVSHAKIVGLGIDTLSIDYGPSKDFEAHKAAPSAGLYHIENVANLDKLPARGAVVFVGPLPFEGGSGSPARVLAIAP